jgi:hypothetical protein
VRIFTAILFFLISPCGNSQETKIYPCRTACNIGIQIGDFRSSDTITVAELLKAERVKAEAGQFKILSYRITMDGCGFDELIEVNNEGDKFCERAILVFGRLRSGSFMSIDCITAKDSYGNFVGLKPAFYIIR